MTYATVPDYRTSEEPEEGMQDNPLYAAFSPTFSPTPSESSRQRQEPPPIAPKPGVSTCTPVIISHPLSSKKRTPTVAKVVFLSLSRVWSLKPRPPCHGQEPEDTLFQNHRYVCALFHSPFQTGTITHHSPATQGYISAPIWPLKPPTHTPTSPHTLLLLSHQWFYKFLFRP